MTATLTRDPVMEARHEAIGAMTIAALLAGLPLPDSLLIPVGGSDDEARELIAGYARSLLSHGVLYRLYDNSGGFGLVITCSPVSACWHHERVATPPLAAAS